MRYDPSYELTEAIKDALTDNLRYEERDYTVFIGLHTETVDRYVQIDYPSLSDAGTKNKFAAEGTISIRIINQRISASTSSEQEMGNIVGDIDVILVGQALAMTTFEIAGVHMYVSDFSTTETLDENNEITKEKVITYSFKIVEK